jgi:hypothetical protein
MKVWRGSITRRGVRLRHSATLRSLDEQRFVARGSVSGGMFEFRAIGAGKN